MPILTQTLAANTTIAIDLSSLPTSSTFLTGRESAQVDNSTTNYIDAIVNVKAIVGHATTAPVVGQIIALYVWGADTSLVTTPIDTLAGADAARTLAHASVLNSLRSAGAAGVTTITPVGLSYYIQPFSVAALFGGVMPKFWGLYVAHNQAGALAAAQTGKFSFNGVTYTST